MNDKIKCIITDDEPFARKGLQSYIEQIDFLDLKGVCENALELNSLLKKEPVDLLFLDIEMPYVTGIDFLKSITAPPKVIFTTAYEKYALQGFELEVLDYLLKPITFDRFFKSANKARDYHQLISRPADLPVQKADPSADYFFIKCGSKYEKIFFNRIYIISSDCKRTNKTGNGYL